MERQLYWALIKIWWTRHRALALTDRLVDQMMRETLPFGAADAVYGAIGHVYDTAGAHTKRGMSHGEPNLFPPLDRITFVP